MGLTLSMPSIQGQAGLLLSTMQRVLCEDGTMPQWSIGVVVKGSRCRNLGGQGKHGFAVTKQGGHSQRCCRESPRATEQRVLAGDWKAEACP
mmetsp:Transcript_40580/g.93267  ORF Transcript_40580/g.93267 Transcript_40580/m.93267 type:complete len:92 (+) Transcript_40580:17-292(+)